MRKPLTINEVLCEVPIRRRTRLLQIFVKHLFSSSAESPGFLPHHALSLLWGKVGDLRNMYNSDAIDRANALVNKKREVIGDPRYKAQVGSSSFVSLCNETIPTLYEEVKFLTEWAYSCAPSSSSELAHYVGNMGRSTPEEVLGDLLYLGSRPGTRLIYHEEEGSPPPYITVVTDPVILEGIKFGRVSIRLFFPKNEDPFHRVRALQPNPSFDDRKHPHLSGGELCTGEAKKNIETAFQKLRFLALVDLLTGVLNTFNPEGAYGEGQYGESLEFWSEARDEEETVTCCGCGESVDQDYAEVCSACSNCYCSACWEDSDCSQVCESPGCDSGPGCQIAINYCNNCGEHSCGDHWYICPDCNEESCWNCYEEPESSDLSGICQECWDKRLEAEAEAEQEAVENVKLPLFDENERN